MSPRTARARATVPVVATTASEGPITLTLPLPPNMANGRMHWSKKHRERVAYLRLCDQWACLPSHPAPPFVPAPRAVIDATLTVWALMDDDNALARLKWAVDWLVTRGYLAGDSRKHLTWRGLPEQRVARKEAPSVTFLITSARRDDQGVGR